MSGPGYFSFAGLFLAPIMFYLRFPELKMQEIFFRRRPSPESKMAPGLAQETNSSNCARESQFAAIFRWRVGPLGVHRGLGVPYGGLVVVVTVKYEDL